MNNITMSEDSKPKTKYLIASCWMRFLARFIDFAIIFLILFFSGVAIFYTDVNHLNAVHLSYGQFISVAFGKNLNQYNATTLAQMFIGWKYCAFSWESFLVFSIWFLLIPFLFKGKTIGKYLCHLQTIDLLNNHHFFWHLIKKELFIWILLMLVFVIYGFVCLGLKQKAYLFSLNYLNSANNYNHAHVFSGLYVFVFLFSVLFMIDIIIVFWMFFTSNKRNLQDQFSNTTVIDLKQTLNEQNNKKDKTINKQKETKYLLPGEVNLTDIDKMLKKSALNKKNKTRK